MEMEKGAFSERLEQLNISSSIHKIAQINLITRVLCSCSLHLQGMFVTHKHHVHYLSASECKPCAQPCGSPSAQLSVQPHDPSGTGSSFSLSPASIAEDVFFNNTNEDQVKLYILDLNRFLFSVFSVLFLANMFVIRLIYHFGLD